MITRTPSQIILHNLTHTTGKCCDSLNTRYVHRSFRDRQIMIALKVDPKTATITEQLAESHRHLCGNRLLPIQDSVQRLP